jgi:hypothetical protein
MSSVPKKADEKLNDSDIGRDRLLRIMDDAQRSKEKRPARHRLSRLKLLVLQ